MLTKQRRQWRGRDRQLLRKLQNTLQSIRDRDERMAEAVADSSSVGFYFGTTANPGIDAALTTLANRIGICLAAKH